MSKILDLKCVLLSGSVVYADLRLSLAEAEEIWTGSQLVVTATTDSALTLGPVTTGDVFYITSDVAVSYKLNASATAVTLDAGGFHLYFGTSITAITITNASGSTATLKYGVWGA